jgi:hypothetical protein
MEAFKRGPGTRRIAASRWGQVLAYYAPVAWAWLALFLPIGLARDGSSIGEKLLLGVVLGTVTDSAYDWTVKALRKFLGAGEPEKGPTLPLPK